MSEITFEVHEEIWDEEDCEIGETDKKEMISNSILRHAISDLSFKTYNTDWIESDSPHLHFIRSHDTDSMWGVEVSNFHDEEGRHHVRKIYFPASLGYFTRQRIARLIHHRSRSW